MAVPISNVTRRVVFAASGVGPYSFTFEILAETDIAVYEDDTLLTLTTDYTVTINANGTGSITLVSSPTGSQISIVGARAIERTSDFVTGGDFFANTLNTELDSLTIFAQQNSEAVARALSAPETDPTTVNMTLPRASVRANKYLAFDSDGNPAAGDTSVDVAAVAAIAGDITTVGGIAANVTTVAGVAANVTTVAGVAANVTTVAGISSDVTAVAADATDIGTVATDLTGSNTIGAVAAIASDVAAVGAITSDVTAVAADATDIGTVATDLAGSNTIGSVAAVASNVTTVAGIAADVTTVAGVNSAHLSSVAGVASSIPTVAGIAANVTTVAGVAANVTTVAGVAANVTTVAGNSTNINTVAGISSNVTTVAGISSAVSTAATNVADITNFSDVYIGPASSDPSTRADSSALQAGDLYFDTTAGAMKVYTGSAWTAAYISADGYLPTSGGTMTGAITFVGGQTFSGTVATSDIGTTVQAYDSNLTSFVNAFTLPTSDGSASQVLQTDGAGNISFATPSAGVTTGKAIAMAIVFGG